jgi:hypothetical protein
MGDTRKGRPSWAGAARRVALVNLGTKCTSSQITHFHAEPWNLLSTSATYPEREGLDTFGG